ncbi:LuxR C-terminal-related transcriptional regulator [Pseudacidobacterium ailaaui]|jgi:DNA-binding NarL/FixJ family response regulator|uniref:LuxR C-terminal-related transcriptional regulator n=1 Tax=Pseudacidobacterium ailaaui TaxID=1382359 RepID=UPI00047D6B74|nr:response regulator transcription factor [Pseudacidobacterium ailaaui]MDI3255652.1 response regulator transcription factor [Bacillota bacterium]
MEDRVQYGKNLRIGLYAVEPIRRAGLRSILEEIRGADLVEADLDRLEQLQSLDVAVISLMYPEDVLPVIHRLRTQQPQMRIVVMSTDGDDETIIGAISAGAKGYLTDTATPEEVKQAIEIVAGGSIWAPRHTLSLMVDRMLAHGSLNPRFAPQFTQRELDVLQLLVSARSNREIAQALGIEVRTVKSYIGRMMKKAGVGNRTALSVHAAKNALVPPVRNF